MSGNRPIDAGSGEIKDGGGGGDDGYENNQQKKVIGYGKRAKIMVLSKIKRAKNRLRGNKKKTLKNETSGYCCWCIGRIPSINSSTESPTSDPNSSGFGFDSLKGLIEKSDFLLEDCNTHLELDVYISDGNVNDDDDD